MKEFTHQYLNRASPGLPPTWVEEVERIIAGGDSMASAEARGVTRDAVKAQRKKIFRRLGVVNGHELLLKMLHDAVSKVPNPK